MKIKVEVTQEDINNGVRQDADNCPIACALKRLVKNPQVEDDIEFDLNEIRYVAQLTAEASVFISKFDEGDLINVLPFSFEIEAEEKYQEDYDNEY